MERIGGSGLVVAAMSTYNANSGRGSIVLRPLDPNDAALGVDQRALAAAMVSAQVPSPNQSVQLFEATPKVTKKKKQKYRAIVNTLEVTDQPKKPVAARVSLEPNDGEDVSTKSPVGIAVSPEQKLESDIPMQKPKKNGAMMKYLRPAAEVEKADEKTSRLSKAAASVPRKLHQEPELARSKYAKGDDIKKVSASTPNKSTATMPLKEKSQNDPEKADRNLEDLSSSRPSKNDGAGKAVDKVKEKRMRSPCVPRKRQFQQSRHEIKDNSLRKYKTPVVCSDTVLVPHIVHTPSSAVEVAEALCDIRRGTPSPKRHRSSGKFTRKTPANEQRPIHPRRKRPRELTTQLPQRSILDMIGTLNSSNTDISSFQEASRMKLAAEHRAGHEMLRKKVFSIFDSVVRSLTRPDPISDQEARIWFNDEITGYKDMLEDMLSRQRMEASTLAAEQTIQQKGNTVPILQVSFPFPEVFDTANTAFERFMNQEKASA